MFDIYGVSCPCMTVLLSVNSLDSRIFGCAVLHLCDVTYAAVRCRCPAQAVRTVAYKELLQGALNVVNK